MNGSAFTASAESGADIMVRISLAGYYDLYIAKKAADFTADWAVGTITTADMTPLPASRSLYVPLTYDGAPYRSFDGLTLTLKNGDTTLTVGTDYTMQYPYVILAESIEADTELTLTITPQASVKMTGGTATGSRRSGSFTTIDLAAWGNGTITLGGSFTGGNNILIFDAGGNLVESGVAAGSYQTGRFAAGTYTVVAFNQNSLFTAVSSVSELTNMGLSDGTDYISGSITIADGSTASLTLTVPVLNTAGFSSILDTNGTAVLVETQDVPCGSTVRVRVQYALKSASSGTVKVTLPADASLVGVYDRNSELNDTLQGGVLQLTANAQSGVFYIDFTVSGEGEHSVSAAITAGGAYSTSWQRLLYGKKSANRNRKPLAGQP